MTDTTDRTVDCPHRVECGACSFLLRPYGEQLERKRRRLTDVLNEQIRVAPRQVLGTLPSPRIEGYRNRAKMAISSNREHRSSLGYFQRRSREVVDAPHCGVLIPELLETTQQLRRLLNSRDAFSIRAAPHRSALRQRSHPAAPDPGDQGREDAKAPDR